MVKSASVIVILVMLGNFSSDAFAGPSYSVECEDISRGTRLHLFDANPASRFMSAEGLHNQLPDGMSSFESTSPGGDTPLQVISYRPYEVELKLATGAHAVSLTTISENGEKVALGGLDKIVLENHSAPEIEWEEMPRLGAATLILSTGLKLRFNNCKIDGDVAVQHWKETFDTTSSN